jgi:hypothetical protein
MVGQAFHLLGYPVSGEHFPGEDDAGMEDPPPLLEQWRVGHLIGEGLLEGVLYLGEQAYLIGELSSLQMAESQAEQFMLSFSKKLANHIGAIRYFISHHNLTRAAP